MGHDFRSLCQVETRRLIWLLGTIVLMVFVLQYLELPYGNLISSLFTAGKVPVMGVSSSQTEYSPSGPEMVANSTLVNGSESDSTETFEVPLIGNNPLITKGQDISLRNTSSLEDASDSEDESPSKDVVEINKKSTIDNVNEANTGPAPEKAMEPKYSLFKNVTEDNNGSLNSTHEDDMPSSLERSESSNTGLASPSHALPPIILLPNYSSPTNFVPHTIANIDTALANNDTSPVLNKDESPVPSLQSSNSSVPRAPKVKKMHETPPSEAISISEMNNLLRQSRSSYHPMKPRWSSAADQELLYAKSQIKNAPITHDPSLYASIYRNVSMFRRSYELMEQTLKVYIYNEGERPIFHQGPLKGIYASEGWFMKLLKANKQFVTKTPKEAHLFYLPFSSRNLEEKLYVPNSHSHKNLIQHLKNYLDRIMAKYPFWNRTGGADHFLVACHDWAPAETRQYMANSIRALCNNDVKEGFIFGKDVSLPETYVRSPQKLLRDIGGKPASQRPILAFFAGRMHGYLRPILLQYWENKDPDMRIFAKMPRVKGKMNYIQHMKSSKYCICAKGYEVNSPRVVEAIFYECVPVIISDDFVPPFFETLNWQSFAVFIPEKDIPNLKKILLSISKRRYLEMQRRVKKVQQHFLWHAKPEKYDMFHMILHSIWYNRVSSIRPII